LNKYLYGIENIEANIVFESEKEMKLPGQKYLSGNLSKGVLSL
jgi:hypothetical protein